jgi:hypothetical protein
MKQLGLDHRSKARQSQPVRYGNTVQDSGHTHPYFEECIHSLAHFGDNDHA